MKNSHPVQLIQHVLRKFNLIIGNVKSKYWVHTQKIGEKKPKSVPEAKSFDENNGNTLLWDAIVAKHYIFSLILEMLWSKTVYFGLLGNKHSLYIIPLYLTER